METGNVFFPSFTSFLKKLSMNQLLKNWVIEQSSVFQEDEEDLSVAKE